MIDLQSRTHVPKTTVSRVCYHCDTVIDMGSEAIRYRGDYTHPEGEGTIFCHVVCADAGEAFAKKHGIGDDGQGFWWLSDIGDHEEMSWVIKHHPEAADMANMPARLMRAALGG